MPSLIITWARSISVFLQLSVFIKKSNTLSVDKRTACGPAAKCIPLRSIWVRKKDWYTNLLEITIEKDTATITAKPVCQSPVNSKTMSVVEIGAPNTAADTAPIPARA